MMGDSMYKNYLKKRQLNKKSFIFLPFLIIATILFTGCKQSNEDSKNDLNQENNAIITEQPVDPSITPTAESDTTTSSLIQDALNSPTPSGTASDSNNNINDATINNGGLYVKYKGDIYYRQYTKDSYSPTGLWGDYDPIADVSKDMVKSKEDGRIEIAFTDVGAGPIYISNDRMYLEKPSQYPSDIYSVRLDGSDPKEIGTGKISGIDEATGTVVCLLSGQDSVNSLTLINGVTGETLQPVLSTPCQKVLAVQNGIIYYQGSVTDEQSYRGKMKLCRVNIDGTGEMIITETEGDLYDFDSYGTEIPCIQFIGNTIYFSYGGYSGTGYFYQGGRIAKVDLDGSNFEILLGKSDGIDVYENLAPATFYIVNEKDSLMLYYTDEMLPSGATYALDLKSRELIPSTFAPVNPEGKPFEYNGGVYIYQNASPALTTLIPTVDYSFLGFEASLDYKYRIKDIEICDDWVYYKLEANEYSADASIGWRDGYKRIKTQIIKQKLGEDTKEILYEY